MEDELKKGFGQKGALTVAYASTITSRTHVVPNLFDVVIRL
jgi:hypothetical protein